MGESLSALPDAPASSLFHARLLLMTEVRYARNGDIQLGYKIVGDGPVNTMYVPMWFSNLDLLERNPGIARGLRSVGEFARLLVWDRRGAGVSDRLCGPATLEQGMDDMQAVLDDAGMDKAALLAFAEGGALSIMMAATHPERVSALILYCTFATTRWFPDYPWGQKEEDRQMQITGMSAFWGTREAAQVMFQADDDRTVEWGQQWQRNSASRDALPLFFEMLGHTDVRHVLPTIQVPTLVLHRTHDERIPVENSRYIADKIPDAKLVEFPGVESAPFLGEWEPIQNEIEEFLTGQRRTAQPDRVLATILFSDIVGSTQRASDLGDSRWRSLLDEHDDLSRGVVEAFGGRVIKTTGDGILATFDGPARAIRCAAELRNGVETIGLQLRVGLHTGEVEVRGDDVGGIAVHIADRVAHAAAAGEVLVSEALPPLVAGSGIDFEARGATELRGIPGEWRLFAVPDPKR